MLELFNWTISIFSLIATWANTKQWTWCFYVWIFTNISYVFLDFVIYHNLARAFLTFVQLIFCFMGINEWRRIKRV
jgi:hypothetical protein